MEPSESGRATVSEIVPVISERVARMTDAKDLALWWHGFIGGAAAAASSVIGHSAVAMILEDILDQAKIALKKEQH